MKRKIEAELFNIPGVIGIGIFLCCGSTDPLLAGLGVMLATNTTPVPVVAETIANTIIREQAGCLGVQLMKVGIDTPRCADDDPACGPLARCAANHAGTACCPTVKAYPMTQVQGARLSAMPSLRG